MHGVEHDDVVTLLEIQGPLEHVEPLGSIVRESDGLWIGIEVICEEDSGAFGTGLPLWIGIGMIDGLVQERCARRVPFVISDRATVLLPGSLTYVSILVAQKVYTRRSRVRYEVRKCCR